MLHGSFPNHWYIKVGVNQPLFLLRAGQEHAAARLADAVAAWDECVSLISTSSAAAAMVLEWAERDLSDRGIRCVRVYGASSGKGFGLRDLMVQVMDQARDQASPAVLTDAELKAAFTSLTTPGEGYDRVALLVTEAQSLLPPAVQYIQLACRSSSKLLVVLAGQPSLTATLADDEFAYMRGRITRNLVLPDVLPDPVHATPLSDAGAPPISPAAQAARTWFMPRAFAKLGLAAVAALAIWTTRWEKPPTPPVTAIQSGPTARPETIARPEAALPPSPGLPLEVAKPGVPITVPSGPRDPSRDADVGKADTGKADTGKADTGKAGAHVVWAAHGDAFPITPPVAAPEAGDANNQAVAGRFGSGSPIPDAVAAAPRAAEPAATPPVHLSAEAPPSLMPEAPDPAASRPERQAMAPERAGAGLPSLPGTASGATADLPFADLPFADLLFSEALAPTQRAAPPTAGLDADPSKPLPVAAEPADNGASSGGAPSVLATQEATEPAPANPEHAATRTPDPNAAAEPGFAPLPPARRLELVIVASPPKQPPPSAAPPSVSSAQPPSGPALPIPPSETPPPPRGTPALASPRPEPAALRQTRAVERARVAERAVAPAALPVQPTDEWRCREITLKFQLGEVPSNADQQFLRSGCRSK